MKIIKKKKTKNSFLQKISKFLAKNIFLYCKLCIIYLFFFLLNLFLYSFEIKKFPKTSRTRTEHSKIVPKVPNILKIVLSFVLFLKNFFLYNFEVENEKKVPIF